MGALGGRETGAVCLETWLYRFTASGFDAAARSTVLNISACHCAVADVAARQRRLDYVPRHLFAAESVISLTRTRST
jgi:hypothetical protein